MARNLDLTALRSLVAVADAGGVTRAAGTLHLTQSAVSMQLKRLEDSMGIALIDRSQRKIALTGAGEQLLSYARRMLDLNDEVLGRLTANEFEGEITLGVPHDIVYPAIPGVLQRFNAQFPRMKVTLISSYTRTLRAQFEKGETDIILATETEPSENAIELLNRQLVWIGAVDGTTWRHRPLKLAFENNCMFRPVAQRALDAADIQWEMTVESDSSRTIEASVSADLAIYTSIIGHEPPYLEVIDHRGGLPDLPQFKITLYANGVKPDSPASVLVSMIQDAFSELGSGKPPRSGPNLRVAS